MCICFIFVKNDLGEDDSYQIIIANNRDEYFARPTKSAHFWNSHCISGLDDEPTKQGGTWFGFSTFGKVGVLLNVLDPMQSNLKKGRGHLVTNYLCGPLGAQEYCGKLMEQASEYNKFNLVLLEKKQGLWQVGYVSNVDQQTPQLLKPGILAFGNSPYNKPWKKVESGKLKFDDIVKNYNSSEKKETLKEKLVELLSDRTSHWPDTQIMSQLKGTDKDSEEFGKLISSNFVDMSKTIQYGTRTHTLLLIDNKGQGEYVEVTMENLSDNAKEWKTTCTEFQLMNST